MILCKNCNVDISELKKLRSTRVFCSKKCCRLFFNKELPWKSRSNSERQSECKICNKTFIRRARSSLYCTRECYLSTQRGKITDKELGKFLVFKRDNFTCIYCGKNSIGDKIKLHVEHIVPFSICKENLLENLVTSCIECNLSKSDYRLSKELETQILSEVKARNFMSNLDGKQKIK